MKYKHVPVLIEEVLEFLNPRRGGFFIDCTLGGAGYTSRIAKIVSDTGKVVAFDLDEMAIKNAESLLKEAEINNVELIKDNFRNLKENLDKKFNNDELFVDGVVLDLGMSSAQLDDKNRGISFLEDRPLDMAFGESDWSTEEIVNTWKVFELENIFKIYGEERFARKIAREIYLERKEEKIKTTGHLVEIIKKSIPKKFQSKKIHPATKVFQALRIATNDEIRNLERVLPQIVNILKPGGRVVVVSFHSLEDRIVKNFFRTSASDCICPKAAPVCICSHQPELKILTKKIVIATGDEVKNNPRARSAKLRAAEKL